MVGPKDALKTDVNERIPTLVPGLDGLIAGGLQKGDFIVVSGGVGCGKTTFAAQFAYNAATFHDEPVLFVTFEEDCESLRRNMRKFGMNFEPLEEKGKFKLLDLEILESEGLGANIDIILAALDKVRAKRLIIDSLTAFLTGAKDRFDYRFLTHLIYKTLKREGVTTMMTVSKSSSSEMVNNTIEEFVADGVFILEPFVSESMELRTRFMVRKLRGADHSKKYHRVAFSPRGIEILSW
jgi:circadian clock protein KaiC